MLDKVEESHKLMSAIQVRVFKMNVQGATLKADDENACVAATETAKLLMQEVGEMQAVAKKAGKHYDAWLMLNKM